MTPLQRTPSLAETVAARLEADLGSFADGRLPRARDLCTRYSASRSTILAALHTLERTGRIEVRQGARTRIVGRAPQPPSPEHGAAERLGEAIRGRVAEGVLEAGESLPKVAHLAATYHGSASTVCAVLRELAREGVVHKAGKAWHAGPPPAPPSSLPPSRRPAIVVLQTGPRGWTGLATERTLGFYYRFCREAESRGIRLLPLSVRKEAGGLGWLPAGKQALRELVRSLHTQYLGALVVSSPAETDRFPEFIRSLLRARQPVVWFDRNDIGRALPEEVRTRRARFLRCHFSEHKGAETALAYLASRGCRTVGFFAGNVPRWVEDRVRALRGAAASMRPAPRVIFLDPRRALSDEEADRRWKSILHKRAQPTTITRSDARGKVFYRLLPLYLEAGIDALVVANDETAERVYGTLMREGVAIERLFTVLSFDNALPSHRAGLSSVDFNFANLAYCAFHYIARDIPVACDSPGNLAIRPYVVERGTVSLHSPGGMQ